MRHPLAEGIKHPDGTIRTKEGHIMGHYHVENPDGQGEGYEGSKVDDSVRRVENTVDKMRDALASSRRYEPEQLIVVDPTTGFQKADGDKIRQELLDPLFLQEVARVMTLGAKKYAAWNWAKGSAYSRCYGSLQRHVQAWYAGEDKDPETGISHLAHAACNLMFLLRFQESGLGEDDRPQL